MRGRREALIGLGGDAILSSAYQRVGFEKGSQKMFEFFCLKNGIVQCICKHYVCNRRGLGKVAWYSCCGGPPAVPPPSFPPFLPLATPIETELTQLSIMQQSCIVGLYLLIICAPAVWQSRYCFSDVGPCVYVSVCLPAVSLPNMKIQYNLVGILCYGESYT